MCNQEIDLSQGIHGHPDLTLIAIVDEQGHVIPVVSADSRDEEQIDKGDTTA